jgi:glucosyl-3-phosphoglycerate synthase
MEAWFDRRTHRSADFDPEDLARRKAELGVSVSVVVPARNEAPTVRGVVESCASMTGRLVDELVVMDGDSEDDTAALAAGAGARVHADRSVLADFGPPLGKGDALWRSLAVTSGDIVVFVDADIRNPDPQFVWGLLGPLLTDPEVELVKAFYDRPVEIAGVQHSTGGGRVTELMARPLLNLFWPDLAGLVQPLSGEYAGRRSLLEELPFFTGYGVELGLLIDALRARGRDAIAQVDVGERIHTNQPLEALSLMAFGILQVAIQRLGDTPEIAMLTYNNFNWRQAGRDVWPSPAGAQDEQSREARRQRDACDGEHTRDHRVSALMR